MKQKASKLERDLTNQIEGVLDYVPALDKIPFHLKREASEIAAKAIVEYLANKR